MKLHNSDKMNMPHQRVQRRLDVRGLTCPLTLLKITRAYRELPAGALLEIIGSDRDTPEDFFKIMHRMNYDFIEFGRKQAEYLIRLAKSRNH